MYALLTDAELFDYSAVSFNIVLLQISQQVSSVTYHLQKTTAGVVILLVNLDVFGELVDSLSENSDLNLRRTCVVLVKAVSLDYGSLFFFS